jgi:hypothetical protein
MKKYKIGFIINPHSFVDIITNSSTELFVCHTDNTLKMVKEILASNPDVYGYKEPWRFDLEKYREWRKKYRSSKETEQDYRNKFHQIEGWFYDIEDEEDMDNLRKEYIEHGKYDHGWNSENQFAERLRKASTRGKYIEEWKNKETEIDVILDEIRNSPKKPDWWIHPYNYSSYKMSVNEIDGCIMIIGNGDNSIPYEEMDWIESTFNATGIHMG